MAATVLTCDKATSSVAPSPGMVMTLHLHATDVPTAKHYAAWAAYVADYNASSDLVSTTIACVTP
jgi:hypothetical protein